MTSGEPSSKAAVGAVRLRPFQRDDCETLLGWIGSADALLGWSGPWDFSWPLDREQLERDLRSGSDDRLLFSALEQGSGELVGHAALRVERGHGLGHITRVLVAPGRRGGGRGTALMRELVRIGFDELRLHRLQLAVYDFNRPAIACYQRLGFVTEGRLRDITKGSNGYWSALTLGLLEPDYRRTVDSRDGRPGVRTAGLTDAGAVADLLSQLGSPHDHRQARERLAGWAADPQGVVLVAEVAAIPVGLVAVHAIPYLDREGACARIVALAVDARHRRTGVGRRLVAAAEAWAVEHGCADVEVTTSRARDHAEPFYSALGYRDLCGQSARFKRTLEDLR